MDSLDTTAEGGEDARHSFEQVPLSPTVSTIPNSVLEVLYSRLVPSTDDTKAQVIAPLLLPVACQLTTDFEKCLQLVEQLQRRHSSAFPHFGTDQPQLKTEMDPEAGKAIQVGAPLLQRCREAVLESLSASVTDPTTADSHTQEVVSLEEQRLQTLLGSLNTPDAPNSSGHSLRTVVLPTIVVFGAYGGRLDHEMAALNCVLKFATMYHILLTNSENVTFACWPDGVTQFVRSPAADIMTPPTCGLIPMGRVHELETTGFRWNMVVGRSSSYDGFTQTSSYNFDFDALVSSCNVMDQPLITVDLRPLHMEPSPPAAPQRAARINPPTFFTYSRRCA